MSSGQWAEFRGDTLSVLIILNSTQLFLEQKHKFEWSQVTRKSEGIIFSSPCLVDNFNNIIYNIE